MASPEEPRTPRVQDIWFLTSELEGERASSFRQSRWCKVFLEAGARISIFNVQGAFALTTVQCKDEQEFAEFRRLSLAKARPLASVREGWHVGPLRWLKHMVLADLYLPNVIKLVWHCHRELARRQAPVAIMGSSPPFSMAIAGAVAKWLHPDKVVLAIDMRDAWAMHGALGGNKSLKHWIELRVLGAADHVTTVSFGLAQEFQQAYGIHVGVMYNVATHYLDTPPAEQIDLTSLHPDIQASRLKIVYTGSTPVGHYDLASLVGAIKLLKSSRPELADRVQLVFVGACDEVRQEADRQGVGAPDLVLLPVVPHALSRSIQASADALLFLAHFGEGNKGVVSTKLFEYLCLGKRVLPVSLHSNSDVDQLLTRYCGVTLNAHTAKDMMQAIARFASGELEILPRLEDANRVRELLQDYHQHAQHVLR